MNTVTVRKPTRDRSAHCQAQSERILAAAQQCFTERGFHGASMAQIAETAGVSAGLIYRYFASKSELIHDIVLRQVELLEEEIRSLKSSPLNAEFLANHFVDHLEGKDLSCMGGNNAPTCLRLVEPALVLEIIAESNRDAMIADALQTLHMRLDAIVKDWMLRPREEGGFGIPEAEIEMRAMSFHALFDGLKMRWARAPKPDPELMRQALSDAFERLSTT